MNNRVDYCYGFAGITGGLGMPTVIAAVLIVVGCVIIKRKNVPKASGECTTVLLRAWLVQCYYNDFKLRCA